MHRTHRYNYQPTDYRPTTDHRPTTNSTSYYHRNNVCIVLYTYYIIISIQYRNMYIMCTVIVFASIFLLWQILCYISYVLIFLIFCYYYFNVILFIICLCFLFTHLFIFVFVFIRYNLTSGALVLCVQQEKYRLRVRASDSGAPPSYAEVDIELDVVDRNNKPPLWERSVYGPTHIKENVTIGTIVISVKARFVFLASTTLPPPTPFTPRELYLSCLKTSATVQYSCTYL